MIKLYIDNIDEISGWYTKEVLRLVKKRKTKRPKAASPLELKFYNAIQEDAFCKKIITLRPDDMGDEYDFVKEYIKLVDFYTYEYLLKDSLSQASGGGSGNIWETRRKEYMDEFSCQELDSIAGMIFPGGVGDVCRSKKNFTKLRKAIKVKLDRLNGVIRSKFNYDEILGGSDIRGRIIRGELVRRLNIGVCPYCNNQDIRSVTDEIYLGDLDHILPKSKYTLFSLSLYNLVPVCKSCNQTFKKEKVGILNPYFDGFENDCILHMNCQNVKELEGSVETTCFAWEAADSPDDVRLKRPGRSGRIRRNLAVFKLNEVYKSKGHARRFKDVYSTKCKDSVEWRETLSAVLNEPIDDTLLYGVSLIEENFQNERLGKAIFDIVKNN